MNTKICTSIKQSKKLIELGIPKNTADMRIGNYVGKSGKVDGTNVHYYTKEESFGAPEIILAWSLDALMKLLPSEFTIENEFGKYKYEIKIRKYKFVDNVDIHQIAYGSYKWYEDGSNSWKDMINTGQKEELLDAAFEMVCWLKENNKI